MIFSQHSHKIIEIKGKTAKKSATLDVNSSKMNEQIKFGKLLSFIDKIVEKKRDCSRNVKILRYKKLVKIYSSSFGNMGESNLKEEERLAEEIQKLPCLYDKGNEGYKEKDRKKNAWCEVEKALSFEEDTYKTDISSLTVSPCVTQFHCLSHGITVGSSFLTVLQILRGFSPKLTVF